MDRLKPSPADPSKGVLRPSKVSPEVSSSNEECLPYVDVMPILQLHHLIIERVTFTAVEIPFEAPLLGPAPHKQMQIRGERTHSLEIVPMDSVAEWLLLLGQGTRSLPLLKTIIYQFPGTANVMEI